MKSRPKTKKPNTDLDYFEFLCLKTIYNTTAPLIDIFDVLNTIRGSFQRRFGVQKHPSGFNGDYHDINTICHKLDDENYIAYQDDGHLYLTSQGRKYLQDHNQPNPPGIIAGNSTFFDREKSHWSTRYFEDK